MIKSSLPHKGNIFLHLTSKCNKLSTPCSLNKGMDAEATAYQELFAALRDVRTQLPRLKTTRETNKTISFNGKHPQCKNTITFLIKIWLKMHAIVQFADSHGSNIPRKTKFWWLWRSQHRAWQSSRRVWTTLRHKVWFLGLSCAEPAAGLTALVSPLQLRTFCDSGSPCSTAMWATSIHPSPAADTTS